MIELLQAARKAEITPEGGSNSGVYTMVLEMELIGNIAAIYGIVESEAKIVRLIYKTFLEGKTPTYIANYLTSEGIPSPRGCKKWASSTVKSILKNEKYKGDALLQKSFTVDFLSKKKKKNEGEVASYYITDSHPAIISREVFDLAQLEFEKRSKGNNYKPTSRCFSGMLFCGECGGLIGSKVWHSTDKYRRVIWQCNNKFKNAKKCGTPHLSDDSIKKAFLEVFNSILDNFEDVVDFVDLAIQQLLDSDALDRKIEKAQRITNKKMQEVQSYIKLNAQTAISQTEYNEKFDRMVAEYEKAKDAQCQLEDEKKSLLDRATRCNAFLMQIKEQNHLDEFDEALFRSIVEKVMVYSDKLIFEFKDGEKREYAL